MRQIDTRKTILYNQLIPVIEAICSADQEEQFEVIMDDPNAFSDLKAYLSARAIGFREIYEENALMLQFKI